MKTTIVLFTFIYSIPLGALRSADKKNVSVHASYSIESDTVAVIDPSDYILVAESKKDSLG